MLGQAPAMQDVFRAIGRLSQSNVTVLITGESGSGKELVARALHKHSPRAERPVRRHQHRGDPEGPARVASCSATSAAPSPARRRPRRGRFEQAEGGTLFLDEIGDMPFDLQTRLLRVLSDGQFYRVGGHQPLKSQRARDRRHPPEPGGAGARGRLPRGPVPPPERHPAAPAAAARAPRGHRRCWHATSCSAAPRSWASSPSGCRRPRCSRCVQFDFPGNVRQLENLCHWLTVMAPAQVVDPKDLPPEVQAHAAAAVPARGGSACSRPRQPAGRAGGAAGGPAMPAQSREAVSPAAAGAAARPGAWLAGLEWQARAAARGQGHPRSGTR